MPLIVFLFNPLLAFLGAMKRLDAKFNGLVFVMFYALFGYAISFTLTSADSYRIGARFCQQNTLLDGLWMSYMEGGVTDVYLLFVFAVLRPMTHNPKVAFCVLGLVMGIFACLSIKQLYRVWPSQRNKFFYLIVFFYFLIISFFNVNGIRFWTATALYSYFVIQYLYFNKKWAVIFVWVSALFHFGLLVGILAFYFYLIFRKLSNKPKTYFVVFMLSFFVSLTMPQSMMGDMISENAESGVVDNKALNSKARNYAQTNDNMAKRSGKGSDGSLYRQANGIFTTTFQFVNRIGTAILLFLLYKRRNSIIQSKKQSQFFCFTLYMYAVAMIVFMTIASGVRFINVANMMFLFWYASVTPNNLTRYWKKQTLWMILLNFYSISFFFFNTPRLVTPLLWIAPPFITILDGIGFGPIDFVDN